MRLQLVTTLSVFAVALAQDRAEPPSFPISCPPAGKEREPLLRFTTPRYNDQGIVVTQCFRVGTECDVHGAPDRSGCPAPSDRECFLSFRRPQDVSFRPTEGKCIDGLCRMLVNEVEDQCDCLTGCQGKSDKGKKLKCIKDTCHAV